MNKITLFLDFDGVLHPSMHGSFCYMHNLFKVLDLYPEMKLVVSSDWRHGATPEYFSQVFGDYIHRVAGVTPHLPHGLRQDEILSYVKEYGLKKFIAIDDDCRRELFNADCSWLFRTNYFKGLDATTLQAFIKFIQEQLAKD